ncbi:MAG: hypothetical protein PV344_09190, partial [Anaplasma sp.]|nr:hypothetical protein [Anaplasma sp.]
AETLKYCKRLNFREDLIFAKNRPGENSGNISTLRKLHSFRENWNPRIISKFQLWPDSRKFEPTKIKSFTVDCQPKDSLILDTTAYRVCKFKMLLPT